jgi:hypothetical protein
MDASSALQVFGLLIGGCLAAIAVVKALLS